MSELGKNNNNKNNKEVARPAGNKPALTAQRFEQELANAPADVQDKLRALLQQLALGAGGAAGAAAVGGGKEPKSMDEHKFWKTQPVVKHGNLSAQWQYVVGCLDDNSCRVASPRVTLAKCEADLC